jgi:chaperonin GroES
MFQPLHDNILIQRIDVYQVGRILIPEVARTKSLKGKVLAVGPGKWVEGVNGGHVRKTMDVQPGDMVIFNSRWNDIAGDHEDEMPAGSDPSLHLIQEADVFLKVKER